MGDRFDRIARKFVPTVAKLSYNPFFKALGFFTDALSNLVYPEFRELPRAHLRARVGNRNTLFFTQPKHLYSGVNFWLQALASGWFRFDYDVVDIGCGCGMKPLTLYKFRGAGITGFSGTYMGIDIDDELLEYCRRFFRDSRFTFCKSSHRSSAYSKDNASSETSYYRIEADDNTKHFVFSTSLFSHLLEDDLRNYVQESYRILRNGGYMRMNAFSMDSIKLGGRWTFTHRIGNAYVESTRYPEAAVGYERDFLLTVGREAGFSHCEVLAGAGQSVLVCRKAG